MKAYRTILGFGLMASVLMGAGLAHAQTTLYVLVEPQSFGVCRPPRCVPESAYLLEIDVERARVRSKTPVPNARSSFGKLAATPDGRFLVWTGAEATTPRADPTQLDRLTLFDRLTRKSTEVIRRPPAACCALASFNTLLAHPTRMRVFARLYEPPAFAIDSVQPATALARAARTCRASGRVRLRPPRGSGVTVQGTVTVISFDAGPAPVTFAARTRTR
jgi:hypothetical protein